MSTRSTARTRYLTASLCLIASLAFSGTALAQTKIFKLASTMPATVHQVRILEEMGREVKEKTGGSLEIQVFPASQLGGIRDFVEGMTMGTIEMAVSPIASLEVFGEPRFALFALPYMFKDDDHISRFFHTEPAKAIFADFHKLTNIRTIGLINEGFRDVWSRKPVRSFTDLKGLKLRVPEIPLYIDMFTALQVNATPLPISDVYTSLQTGTIDGLEIPFQVVMDYQYFEVTKFRITTQHCGNPMAIIISDMAWESLSDEERAVLMDVIADAEKRAAAELAALPEKYKDKFVEVGMETINLPEAEMDKIRAAVAPVRDAYVKKYASQELLDSIATCRDE